MRYELWARIDGSWRKVYDTNHYGFAENHAKWRYQQYKTAIYDNERHTLVI